MFGYVKPYTNELRVLENEVYKGIYCGFCKQLGNKYGFFSRFVLNYDFAFMALLSAAISDEEIEFKKEVCIAHAFSKRNCCKSERYFEFPCAASLLMLKYKLIDNFNDNSFKEKLISRLAYPFLFFSIRKAAKNYPDLDFLMKNMTENQRKCESLKESSIDVACEQTALALSKIFLGLYDGNSESQKRVLERLGYLLGRFVYMIDAADDLQHDLKTGDYNPFILKYNPKNIDDIINIIDKVSPSIYLTIGEITKTFELLEIKRFKGIVQNIFCLGLKNSIDNVIIRYKTKETSNAKSL